MVGNNSGTGYGGDECFPDSIADRFRSVYRVMRSVPIYGAGTGVDRTDRQAVYIHRADIGVTTIAGIGH